MKPLGLISRIIAGGVLVVSGTFKAASPPEEFALIISAYQLVPPDLAQSLAIFLPWFELLVGYCLILGYQTRLAAVAAGALFGSFIVALLSLKLRAIELSNCGCFGVRGFHPSPNATLAMDIILLFAVYGAFARGRNAWSLDRWAGL